MSSHYCEKCKRVLDQKNFYHSRNLEKFPDGGCLNQCKDCITMHVDNWDPNTFKPILEEIDVPYIPDVWDRILAKHSDDPKKITGKTILGKYLAQMRIVQYKDFRYADTEEIALKKLEEKKRIWDAQELSEEEIQRLLAEQGKLLTERPVMPLTKDGTVNSFEYDEPDDFASQLTDEDKLYLKMKWGRGYRCDEWVTLENLYNDMEKSYDIQNAGHRDTLKMICKASLKANQCIDANDIEGFQKVSKTYDMLMKSGHFTAAQNKEEQGEFIDSIGELVALCEKQGGFIPTYYDEQPKDKVDKILKDYQLYVKQLISEETNLEELVKRAVKGIEKEEAQIAESESNGVSVDDRLFEDVIFEDEQAYLSDEDFIELRKMIEEQAEEDELLLNKESEK